MENNRSYFMRRAAQERSAATHAQDTKVRELHETLAARYTELAHESGSEGSTPAA
jgi:hypothetical protein